MIHATEVHGKATSRDQEKQYLAGWQRARAELLNYRKRSAQQQADMRQAALRAAIDPLLGLGDNLQSIARHVPAALQTDNWVQGVLHVVRQFETVLQSYNLKPINQAGVPFDPRLHEAVENITDSTVAAGQVAEIIQPGYRLHEQVIRPAKVKVAM